MATDLESLVLSISADTTQLKRALQRTQQDAKGTADSINRSFQSIDPLGRAAANFNRSSRAIAADAQNIKFQLGDIASQIGSGTSALQAFAQQSGQLGQAISSGGIAAVGVALKGMLNPLFLIPAAIGLAMPAIQSFFAESEDGGKDAAKALEAQRDLIRQVAKEWGAALPALAAYNAQLEAQEAIAKQIAANQAGRQKTQADATSAIEATSAALAKILPLFERFPKLAGQVGELRSSWEQLQKNIENGTATLAEVEALQAKFNGTLAKLPVQSARKLAEEVRSNVIPALREAIGTMERLRTEAAQLASRQENQRIQGRMNLAPFNQELSTVPAELAGKDAAGAFVQGASERLKELEPEFASTLQAFMDAAPGKISINSGRRSTERQAELWREALAKYGSADAARKWVAPPGHSMHERGGAADLGYESEAVKRWAHENAAAYGLVFRLKNEDWHIELARAEATKATASAQRDQTAAAGGLYGGTVQLTEAQRRQLEAQDETRRNAEALAAQWSGTLKNALGGFVGDLRQGVEAGDAFKNMLNRVIDGLVNTALEAMFAQDALGGVIKQFFGLGGGGSGIISGLPFPSAPTWHTGGKVGGSQRSMRSGVNPAMFAGAPRLHNGLASDEFPAILQKGEVVIPKNLARQPASNSGNVYFGDVTVNANGGVVASTAQGKALGEFLEKAMSQFVVRERKPGGLLRS
ncbi:D-alanyl-D-alanine carboxypeptidase family protein [Ensifer sp. ENS07]|uniref:D-alanyl-D-alanine carboxypeptidase family protein n=1 Tax=Ensifer sp. ENS07 TaxID=2769274 RepID=UPI001786A68D|nr:D-alanyl-D-alanine carboxypeptidase family protein [Ensifer sp. ENS07]MBD9636000.1 D-alanyl-D-alanine carboxypeptidase family protein [Ensifer sp. ENS07]